MKNGIKEILNILLVTIVSIILVLVINRMIMPCYYESLAEDIKVDIVATSEQNEDALANNVRLTEVSVNGKALDLSKIKVSGAWNYLEKDKFLYAYNIKEATTLSFVCEDVKTLDLKFVSEVGSGIAKVYINNKLFETLDLYSDNVWEYVSVSTDANIFIHPEAHWQIYFVLFVIFALIYGVVFSFIGEDKAKKVYKAARYIFACMALSLLVHASVSMIQYETVEGIAGYFSNGYLNVLQGYMLVLLIFVFIAALSRSLWLPYGILSIVLGIAGIVSNMKLDARGVPLLPWDFKVLNTALTVAGGYKSSINAMSIFVIVCSIIVTLALFANREKKENKISWKFTLPAAAGLLAVLFLFVSSTILSGIWSTKLNRVYQVDEYYNRKGFLVAFTEYITYMLPQEAPEGYDKASMTDIAESVISSVEEDNNNDNTPNIIVIMSESFWDINRLENVEFAEDPLPVFNALKNESLHGNILSHIYGGNTVVSEFECLTGYDGSFFPQDYMVYGGYMKDNFNSVVAFLEEKDYYTVAMHPFIDTNYNRNVAYEKFGFDEMIFEDDFEKDTERIREYISDQAMYEKIFEMYEEHDKSSDSPFFTFAITMQNHGAYTDYLLNEETEVEFTAEGYNSTTIGCMKDYFAGLRASDEALGNLIEYFRNVDEETIIIYFGDHMTDTGNDPEKMLSKESWYKKETVNYEVQSHLAPFIIWNNKSSESKDLGLMNISQLLPTAFETNDISMPYFWEYLLDLKEAYLATNKVIFVDSDNSVKKLDEMNETQKEAYKAYEFLQYDYIWGKGYADDLWELPDK